MKCNTIDWIREDSVTGSISHRERRTADVTMYVPDCFFALPPMYTSACTIRRSTVATFQLTRCTGKAVLVGPAEGRSLFNKRLSYYTVVLGETKFRLLQFVVTEGRAERFLPAKRPQQCFEVEPPVARSFRSLLVSSSHSFIVSGVRRRFATVTFKSSGLSTGKLLLIGAAVKSRPIREFDRTI